MNKTIEALKLAEEALDELRYANDTLIAKTKYYKTLAAIREARAEQDHIADAGKVIAEPVKQEPVAFVSDVHLSRYTLEWNGQPLPEGTKLYAAPVSVEAIRAEALEEAAKWCEAKQSYSAMHANTEFAAGIRGLK